MIVLDDTARFVRRFVVVTSVQADTVALWTAHTYAVDAFDTTPYLALTSAEKRSGKSRLLEVLELLVRSPLSAVNMSDAVLFRAVESLQPTLLLDEADAIFGAKSKEREDLRGMLNAGWRRGAKSLRMGGGNHTTLEHFAVFCPKVFAGIGNYLPDTLADRTIRMQLERRTREEVIERFRRREVIPEAELLSARIAEWLEPQVDELRAAWPKLPDELDDRAWDYWEPLLAIADLAGEEWGERARAAAVELSSGEAREDDSLSLQLLADIRTIFSSTEAQRFKTSELIDELGKIEESPWGDWYGKPISPQGLSKLLRPYRIKTLPVWIDGTKARGYKREQFVEAWNRYLTTPRVEDGEAVGAVGLSPQAIRLLPPLPPLPPRTWGKREIAASAPSVSPPGLVRASTTAARSREGPPNTSRRPASRRERSAAHRSRARRGPRPEAGDDPRPLGARRASWLQVRTGRPLQPRRGAGRGEKAGRRRRSASNPFPTSSQRPIVREASNPDSRRRRCLARSAGKCGSADRGTTVRVGTTRTAFAATAAGSGRGAKPASGSTTTRRMSRRSDTATPSFAARRCRR